MADAPINTLKQWFQEDLRYANWNRDVEILKDTETECSIRIYTETHKYHIGAKNGPLGYMGCEATTRKPRAGEDHTRGNDLPDGHFTRENWSSIIASIVGYELVRVHRHRAIPQQNESTSVVSS